MASRWQRVLQATEHRPYPMPDRPWALKMRWRDLLFAHWPMDPQVVRAAAQLPDGLELDTWAGAAWIGIVPFRMCATAPRGLPAPPGKPANFLELNVRTYVRLGDRQGVWFFSLDANSGIAVGAARAAFRLPYHHAQMKCHTDGDGWVHYHSERRHRGVAPGVFSARYRPAAPLAPAEPGSLAHWLTERYFLAVAGRRGALQIGEIQHRRWPLQDAAAEIASCTVSEAFRLPLPDMDPVLHFARDLDVVAWLLAPPSTG